MNDLRKAAEQALDALRYTTDHLPAKTGVEREVDDAITALQVTLAKPEMKELTAHDRYQERQRIAEEQHIKRANMKIYCELCKKVQPVQIDNGIDVKTKKPYQDIVCNICNLVIASGTDISPPKKEWVGLTDEERADCWSSSAVESAISIEQALRDKNT